MSASISHLKSLSKSIQADISNNSLGSIINKTKQLIYEIDTLQFPITDYIEIFFPICKELLQIKTFLSKYPENNPLHTHWSLFNSILILNNNNNLCKCYLLSIVGTALILSNNNYWTFVHTEIEKYLKQIPYNINLFFVRYYAYNALYEVFKESSELKVIEYLLENITEMSNSLRKLKKQKNVVSLHCWIIEHCNWMISHPKMSQSLFKEKIMGNLFSIIFDSEGENINDYIWDWFVLGWNEEYILATFEEIMGCLSQITDKEDSLCKKTNILLERIILFYNHITGDLKKQTEEILKKSLPIVFEHWCNIFTNSKDISMCAAITPMGRKTETMKREWPNAINKTSLRQFMHYIKNIIKLVIIATQDKKDVGLYIIIFSLLDRFYQENKPTVKPNHIKKWIHLFAYLGTISFLELPIWIRLSAEIDNDTCEVNLYLLNTILTKPQVIDTEEKMNLMMTILKRILGKYDHNMQFPIESDTICLILKQIKHKDPEVCFNWYLIFKEFFLFAKSNEMNFSLHNFYNCIITLIVNIGEQFYRNIRSEETVGNSNRLDLSNYTEESIISLQIKCYKLLYRSIKQDLKEYCDINLPVVLSIIKQMNTLTHKQECFMQTFFDYLNCYWTIIHDEFIADNEKLRLLIQWIETLSNSNILTNDKYFKVVCLIETISNGFNKRADTTRLKVLCCDLYFNPNYLNCSKIKSLWNEAIQSMEYVIENIKYLDIYLLILNRLWLFWDKWDNVIFVKSVNKIIEIIKINLPDLVKEDPSSGNDNENELNKCLEYFENIKFRKGDTWHYSENGYPELGKTKNIIYEYNNTRNTTAEISKSMIEGSNCNDKGGDGNN